MAVRSAQLQDLAYVPSYNTLDTNLVNHVSDQVQQQSARARQYGSDIQQDLQEQVLSTTTGLPEEFQSEAIGLVDESIRNIDQIFEQRGARGSMPAIQREAQNIQRSLQPYQQAAQQVQQARERIDTIGAEKNVDSRVRQYLQSQIGVDRDQQSGRLQFRGMDTTILDNWRDLHEVARETIKDVEANVEESGVHLQEGQDFYQRVKHKYRNFDKLQAVGVSRLLSDRDAVRQMKLQLEAEGVHFEGGIAKQMNEQGELEAITFKEDGQTYKLTEQEAIEQEAVRAVNPTAAARTMQEQTFSYTTKNQQYFNALNNDAGGDYITYNRSTVAGVQPIDNPVQLSTEIETTYDNVNRVLAELEDQGIVQKTSSGEGMPQYRVLDEGRYNGYSGQIRGLKDHIQKMERHQERLQLAAFRNYYGDTVDEQNLDDYIYKIREGDEQFKEIDASLRHSLAVGDEAKRMSSILRRLPTRLDEREIVDLAAEGKDPVKDLGFHEHLTEKQIEEVQRGFKGIKNRYEKRVNDNLSELSPEYKTYSNLIKEDAKGRTVSVPIMRPTNADVINSANDLMEYVILAGSGDSASEDLKWFNTDKAHQSLFETGEDEDIDSYEFSGFAYHPDSGEPILLYSAQNESGTQGMVYVPSSPSFRRHMPVNDRHAKEGYYNNMLNVIGSQPSREGKVTLILDDIFKDPDQKVEVEVIRPIRKQTNEGIPIVRGEDPEFEFVIRHGGKVRRETFSDPSEASGRLIELEENIRRAAHERQQQE